MSNLSDVYKKVKENHKDFYFGEGNWKMMSNKYFTYKSVVDEDNIILLTGNVKRVKDSFVLVIGPKQAIYLKDWQVERVRNWREGIEGYTVKLNRNYFKVYTFKSEFEEFSLDKVEDFDSLKEIASTQNSTLAFGWAN